MEFDLLQTITDWMNEYADRRTSKKYGTEYLAIPIQRRKELFRHLVQTIKDRGKPKEYFRPTILDTIVKSCFPPEEVAYDAKKRRMGISVAKRELEFVLAEIFVQKCSVAPASTYVSTSNDYDPSKHKPISKPLDRSIFDNAPKPNTGIDKEASDILGFGDDE